MERRIQEKPRGLTELRGQTWVSWEDHAARVYRTEKGEERAAQSENIRELHGGLLSSVNIKLCNHVGKWLGSFFKR